MCWVTPQGSYWAIDTNPKEDATPSRPKKRPRSGERVSRPSKVFFFFFTYVDPYWLGTGAFVHCNQLEYFGGGAKTAADSHWPE